VACILIYVSAQAFVPLQKHVIGRNQAGAKWLKVKVQPSDAYLDVGQSMFGSEVVCSETDR